MLVHTSSAALSWLAGFLDAEGHFGFDRSIRFRLDGEMHVSYYPLIVVAHTDEATLLSAIYIFDSLGLGDCYDCGWHRPKTYPTRQYYWRIKVKSYKRCMQWLNILIPHLRTKLAEARLLHEYCSIGLGIYHDRNPELHYSNRELQLLGLLGVPKDFSARSTKRTTQLACSSEPITGFPTRSEEEDVAWLAGFFDGDGSIARWLDKYGGRRLELSFSNTHMPTMPYIIRIIDKYNIMYRHQSSRHMSSKKDNPQWRISTQGYRKSVPLLELMLPYMITNYDKALETILSFKY